MSTYTLELGGLHDEQHVVEDLKLDILPHLGAIRACQHALDQTAATRKGVAVIGPKGMGKSLGLAVASDLFAQTERLLRERDNSYRIRKILRLDVVRDTSYREFGVLLAKRLAPEYSDRIRGRRKDANDIRREIVQMCIHQRYAVLALDEADAYSDHALKFVRDLMAEAESKDASRYRSRDSIGASGIGVLFLGSEGLRGRLQGSEEAGERWMTTLNLPGLTVREVAEVCARWFPGFNPHIEKVGLAGGRII